MSASGLRFHDCSFFANEDSLDGSGFVAAPRAGGADPLASASQGSQGSGGSRGSEAEGGLLLLFNRDPPPGYVKTELAEKAKPRLMLGILRPPALGAGGKKPKQQKQRKKKVTIRVDPSNEQLSSLTTGLLAQSPPKRTKAKVEAAPKREPTTPELSIDSASAVALPALLMDGPASGMSKASRKAAEAAEKLRLDRTGNACLCCRQAKIRCDEQYPCRRCVKKGQECIKTVHLPRGRKPKPGPLSLYLRKKKKRLEMAFVEQQQQQQPLTPAVTAAVVTVDVTHIPTVASVAANTGPFGTSSTIPPVQAALARSRKQATSKDALNVLLRHTLGGLSNMTRNLQQTIFAQRKRSQDAVDCSSSSSRNTHACVLAQ
jgi:hypothetical protein